MSHFRRRLLMQKSGILPSGYTQLEYISNGGTAAYVDTGIVMKLSYHMIIDFSVSAMKSVTPLWGGSAAYAFQCNTTTSYTLRFGGINYQVNSTTVPLDTLTRAEAKDRVMTINGKKYASGTTEDTSNWLLFRANYNSGYYTKNSVYYFKVCDGDTVLMELIPAKRNSDSVVGMYDLVSNKFITPTGGTLTAGPKV